MLNVWVELGLEPLHENRIIMNGQNKFLKILTEKVL